MGNVEYIEMCEISPKILCPTHGARHGKTERKRIYHTAYVAAKRQIKGDMTPYWHEI